jgi:putative alpha-1,2-mannosidase
LGPLTLQLVYFFLIAIAFGLCHIQINRIILPPLPQNNFFYFEGAYYNAYNEPDLQAPFLYDYSGEPWKTQAVTRMLQLQVYNTTISGIPGNDDLGTMSAWFVLSALGIYQVDPSLPYF